MSNNNRTQARDRKRLEMWPQLVEALKAAARALSGRPMTKADLIKELEQVRDTLARAKEIDGCS